MKHYSYKPKNTCSTKFNFDIENNIITNFEIIGGCPGNTKGICKLIIGMPIKDVIKKLQGIDCRNRGTSCCDQIAQALITINTK